MEICFQKGSHGGCRDCELSKSAHAHFADYQALTGESRNQFQDGHHGTHIGFCNTIILAKWNIINESKGHIQLEVNGPNNSGEEVVKHTFNHTAGHLIV